MALNGTGDDNLAHPTVNWADESTCSFCVWPGFNVTLRETNVLPSDRNISTVTISGAAVGFKIEIDVIHPLPVAY